MFDFIAQAAESAQTSFFSGWDPAVVTGGSAAAALGIIWVFIRVVRAVVGTLFMLCVVYLVLKVCFDIDLSAWQQPLLKSVAA